MRSADYVEMTTTSIAGTSGNGAVTCTQITSTPTFTLALGSGACTVRYVIEDTVTKKFETGIGSVAANVLTRTKPQVTWDGTTWTDNAPAALQFGSTPPSGDIKIRLAATAEGQGVVMAGINSTVGRDGYEYSADMNNNSNGTQHTPIAAREHYIPYLLPNAGLLTGVRINIGGFTSAGAVKMALYSCGKDGLPAQKIVNFTGFSITGTGDQTDTATASWSTAAPVKLPAGWYFIGMITSTATFSILGHGTGTKVIRNPLGRHDGYGAAVCAIVAGNYTTGLPANPSPTSLLGQANNAGFWVGLRVLA